MGTSFKWEINVGNVLTASTMIIGIVLAYATLQSDVADARSTAARLTREVERLQARDEIIINQLTTLQRETLAEIVRLRTQVELLLPVRPPLRNP